MGAALFILKMKCRGSQQVDQVKRVGVANNKNRVEFCAQRKTGSNGKIHTDRGPDGNIGPSLTTCTLIARAVGHDNRVVYDC
jgi:hypothetical protein